VRTCGRFYIEQYINLWSIGHLHTYQRFPPPTPASRSRGYSRGSSFSSVLELPLPHTYRCPPCQESTCYFLSDYPHILLYASRVVEEVVVVVQCFCIEKRRIFNANAVGKVHSERSTEHKFSTEHILYREHILSIENTFSMENAG
jgi:hypothetical protein